MTWQTIGFDDNKAFFTRTLAQGRLSHAYLFSGPESIGKKTFALELAQRLGTGIYDLRVISPEPEASRIAIEQIRDIKIFLSLSPLAGERKVVIIDDAHTMTPEAQNSLLKVLEEPSASSVIILISALPQLLLPTALSRCQEIKFLAHPEELIKKFLAADTNQLSDAQAEFLAKFSGGRLGLIKDIIAHNSMTEIKQAVAELADLLKQDLNARFIRAQELTDEKNKPALQKKILFWLLYLRSRLDKPKTVRVLKGLLALQQKLGRAELNHRLAVEEFLLQI